MEESKIANNSVDLISKKTIEESDWRSFRNNQDGIRSRAHIKKSFFDEHKHNVKNWHFNKRKTLRPIDHSDSFMRDLCPQPLIFPMERNTNQVYQTAIPNTVTYSYEGLGSRIYNTKFTSDGKKLVVATQNGTSVFNYPADGHVELSKTARCQNINWTITDLDISTDDKYAVHSTLSPFVHMFDIENGTYVNQFSLKTGSTDVEMADELFWFFSLRIYSLKLSGDNKEIIAGCGKALGGAPVQIFDIPTNKIKQSIFAHKEDINSVCYLDKSNTSIFISASDDGVCKLWDTRILKNFEPVGIFYGHVSGLTHIESKGDNRYFISNCKDQSIKLWDVRNYSTEKKNYPFLKYDYRHEILGSQHIDQIKTYQKKFDQSVMSYWGHQVHSTLIRSHFSPVHGTNQRFIYSGSYDGKVYIYDINTGENVAYLEVPNDEGYDPKNLPVRDCAWHPYAQNLVSGNFNQDIHRWEYLDLRDTDAIIPKGETMEEERGMCSGMDMYLDEKDRDLKKEYK